MSYTLSFLNNVCLTKFLYFSQNTHPIWSQNPQGWAFSNLKLTSYYVPKTPTHHFLWGKHGLSGRFVIYLDNGDVCRGHFKNNHFGRDWEWSTQTEININPLSPHDALNHHFTSQKADLISFPTTKSFRMNIFMKLVYQYTAIFFSFSPTSSHLRPLQVENCDSNSRLVVEEDDNDKFRLQRVKTLNW